jgi:hypothetical protein
VFHPTLPLIVKRLIRDVSTGKFLTSDGAWSGDALKALDFSGLTTAIAARDNFDLKHVEYVLLVGEAPSAYDVTIPLLRANSKVSRIQIPA